MRSRHSIAVRRVLFLLLVAGFVPTTACVSDPVERAREPEPAVATPGRLPDGRTLLPNDWILDPEGAPLALGDFPAAARVSSDGRWLAVVECGAGANGLTLVDLATWTVADHVKLDKAYLGVRFAPTDAHLLVSGGTGHRLHRFAIEGGRLVAQPALVIGAATRDTDVVGFDTDGTDVFAAIGFKHQVVRLSLEGRAAPHAVRPGPAGELFPYDVVHDADQRVIYVSLQGSGEVAVLKADDLSEVGRVRTGTHPNELLLDRRRRLLFVACANDATVRIVDVAKPSAPIVKETLNAALHPEIASGHTSSSLALSPDGCRLYVADSDAACVAVFDVSEPGESRGLGFIPVGWYPTQVRLSPDGHTLYTVCGKGFSSLPNLHGPQPGKKGRDEWIGSLLPGGALKTPVPDDDALERLTVRAFRSSPAQRTRAAALAALGSDAAHPLARSPSAAITHCIYIIKENRTYDQVLGDMPEGNGDPSLCLFGDAITPNHHALARDFVLLDNFYVDAEVSADGHEWTMGAYATDFVEKTWPVQYGGRGLQYPSEGAFKTAEGDGGHLWDRAAAAHVTYRSYGEFVTNGAKPGDPATASVKVLEGHIDPLFRSFDTNYTDHDRAEEFLREFRAFEQSGEMPRLITLRLPNDHTAGTRRGVATPRAMVADNDVALGTVIEALSKSRFWPHLAVFVLEDDAQNGPDHVDAHRSPAFVISPYTRGRGHDGSHYTTTSMLRTIGLVLGLEPLSIHDAHARAMFGAFRDQADLRPWIARPNATNVGEKGVASAWGADLSEGMDFTKADAAPDLLLNEIVWRSIRGADSPMPPPVRSALIRTAKPDDDDDE